MSNYIQDVAQQKYNDSKQWLGTGFCTTRWVVGGAVAVMVTLFILVFVFANKESFSVSMANTQRFFSHDDRVGHNVVMAPSVPTEGTVLPGAAIQIKGAATEKFTEFARIDAIDSLHGESQPTHMPHQSDEELSANAY